MDWYLLWGLVPVATACWMSFWIGRGIGWGEGYDVGRVSYHAEVDYVDIPERVRNEIDSEREANARRETT